MLRALYSAAAGMESQQMNLDVISNNLANVNTTGFKKSKIEFQELLYSDHPRPRRRPRLRQPLPTGIQVGQGSRPVATARIFTNGDLTQTGEQLDVGVQGSGFFEVQMPDGSNAYTRDGAFKTDANGRIVTSDGLPVIGGFQPVPSGTTNITIGSNGNVILHRRQRHHRVSNPARQLQQPRRTRKPGQQSLQGNRRVRHPSTRHARLEWVRHVEPGLPRTFQRQRCGGDGQPHPGPARL